MLLAQLEQQKKKSKGMQMQNSNNKYEETT